MRSRAEQDIVTLAGFELRLWTVNGVLRAVGSLADEQVVMGKLPTAMIATACPDWALRAPVAVVGHDSGAVSLWSLSPPSASSTTTSSSSTAPSSPSSLMPPSSSMAPEAATTEYCAADGPPGPGTSDEDLHSEQPLVESARHTVMPRAFELQLFQPTESTAAAPVTALRVSESGSDLLVGDAVGNITRYTTPRLDQLSLEDIDSIIHSSSH